MLRIIVGLACVAGIFATPLPKIVNGTDAKENEIPYIVSLRYNGRHICGGSILDATHILTAAHCVYQEVPAYHSIQYGVLKISSGEQNSIALKSIDWHESYRPGSGYFNDVAVLTLVSPIPLGPNAQPTKLPVQGAATPGNEYAVLAGWGYPYSGGSVMEHLQRVDIICYTDDNCEKAHSSISNPADRRYHVCAGIPEGGKGQCSGDSGGPLTVKGVQQGIVSWSVKPCAVKGYPGVFAKVASYIDWIKKHMNN